MVRARLDTKEVLLDADKESGALNAEITTLGEYAMADRQRFTVLGSGRDQLVRALAQSRRLAKRTHAYISTATTNSLLYLPRYVKSVRQALGVTMCGACNSIILAAGCNTDEPCSSDIPLLAPSSKQ